MKFDNTEKSQKHKYIKSKYINFPSLVAATVDSLYLFMSCKMTRVGWDFFILIFQNFGGVNTFFALIIPGNEQT